EQEGNELRVLRCSWRNAIAFLILGPLSPRITRRHIHVHNTTTLVARLELDAPHIAPNGDEVDRTRAVDLAGQIVEHLKQLEVLDVVRTAGRHLWTQALCDCQARQ